jgi:hypothetical protein
VLRKPSANSLPFGDILVVQISDRSEMDLMNDSSRNLEGASEAETETLNIKAAHKTLSSAVNTDSRFNI